MSCLLTLPLAAQGQASLLSPGKALRVQVQLSADQAFYDVSCAGWCATMPTSPRACASAVTSAVRRVSNRYTLRTAKRQSASYVANEQIISLKNAGGQPLNIIFRASDDGIAFRYYSSDRRSVAYGCLLSPSPLAL